MAGTQKMTCGMNMQELARALTPSKMRTPCSTILKLNQVQPRVKRERRMDWVEPVEQAAIKGRQDHRARTYQRVCSCSRGWLPQTSPRKMLARKAKGEN